MKFLARAKRLKPILRGRGFEGVGEKGGGLEKLLDYDVADYRYSNVHEDFICVHLFWS